MSRENDRVRRTRTLLRQALVELIEEHGFERLTVGQITERAMVSRAAFYRNYRDKYQLVEQIFDDAMAGLLGTMTDAPARPCWSGGPGSSSTSTTTTASTARATAAPGSRAGCRPLSPT
ncbi:hypothetical protein GCM10023317_93250 [Actinopolymorpha pittospori]